MRDMKRVLVLAPHGVGFARQIVRGVREHGLIRGDWVVVNGELPDRSSGYDIAQADGLICLCGNPELEAVLLGQRVPVVNVSARMAHSRLPRVVVDNRAVGQVGAQHLIERGFRDFAFAPVDGMFYSDERQEGFFEALRAHNMLESVAVLPSDDLEQALQRLPRRSVGIMAANDLHAQRLMDACFRSNIAMPEQVAVVGVDNDTFICEGKPIGLTSVDTRGHAVGVAAAELLARLMAGQRLAVDTVTVPCGAAVVRQSTDTLATSDAEVAFAARYIRDHACNRLGVDDIVAQLNISRRSLETRFRRVFGRSLHDEMRRQQIARAKHLLRDTDLPVQEVGRLAGFCDRIAFGRAFRAAVGVPPGQYRDSESRRA